MKLFAMLMVVSTTLMQSESAIARTDALCAPLLSFVKSIHKDEKRELAFHTSWGGNFNDSQEKVLWATRCSHNNYEPAKVLCNYLTDNTSVEFPNHTLTRALICLYPKTRLDPRLSLDRAEISTSYGTENRGSLVEITLAEDPKLGGMVLRIVADGY